MYKDFQECHTTLFNIILLTIQLVDFVLLDVDFYFQRVQ